MKTIIYLAIAREKDFNLKVLTPPQFTRDLKLMYMSRLHNVQDVNVLFTFSLSYVSAGFFN